MHPAKDSLKFRGSARVGEEVQGREALRTHQSRSQFQDTVNSAFRHAWAYKHTRDSTQIHVDSLVLILTMIIICRCILSYQNSILRLPTSSSSADPNTIRGTAPAEASAINTMGLQRTPHPRFPIPDTS